MVDLDLWWLPIDKIYIKQNLKGLLKIEKFMNYFLGLTHFL